MHPYPDHQKTGVPANGPLLATRPFLGSLHRFTRRLRTSLPALVAGSVLAVGANAQANRLVAGDFEGITSITSYWPATPGVWGAESSALRGAGNGITPFGSQMLQLNHAGGGTAAQTAQIAQGPFPAGSVVTLTAKFNTWLTGQNAKLDIMTNSGLALTGARFSSPATPLDSDLTTWQTVTATTTLAADTNYLAAEIIMAQGSNGALFGIPLAYVDDVVLTVVPPTPRTNWVNWTGSESSGGITKYVGTLVVPRTGGGSTNVIVKYTPPTQSLGFAGWPGIAFPQFSGSADYYAQGGSGSLGRNPARSPYTSSKVINIPDGGGAASDRGDIIALQFAGTNKLEFFDASTGQPISVASPVFAYVSLNGNGYGFDQDFDILSFGDGVTRDQGFFGAGSSRKNVVVVGSATQYQLLQASNPLGGGEPHGALQFRGSFTQVSWQSLSNEIWNGFTIGVAQLAADVPIANAGLDQTVTATSASGAAVQLSGGVSGSTNSPFTFSWSGPFGTTSGQNPTVTLPEGTHTITLTVTDAANSTDTDTVVVVVLPRPADTTPPVITGPGNLSREADGPSGTFVTFAATAQDNVDGPVAVVAIPPSGSLFPLGTTTVDLGATDQAGNRAYLTFTVTVRDTIAPVVSVPGNVTVEATGASGAVVSYPAPTATDAVGVTSLMYSIGSGSTFPLGTTTVTATARDAAGNVGTASFTVTVVDTTAPAIAPAANVTAEATSAAGAVVNYVVPSASDAVSTPSVVAAPASGSTFPLGTTTVTVFATDAAGNASNSSFTVTVQDTTAPALTVPANQVVEATSAAGATATFAASATDAVGVVSLTTSAASGSTFPLGTTTVTVTATDAAGNASSGSFTVTVQDTTAPALTVPANQVLEATGAGGAIATFAASATDAVGVTSLTTSAASGSTFPIGTTTVTVTAKDAAGNTTTGSFTVTVRDTTAPAFLSLTPSTGTLWPPNHKMVAVRLTALASDVVGISSLKIVGVTSSEPDNGLGDGDTAGDIQVTGDLTLNLRAERSGRGNGRTYTITVEARDAAGNATTRTTTVLVPKSQGK